jgi:hypothetical protein
MKPEKVAGRIGISLEDANVVVDIIRLNIDILSDNRFPKTQKWYNSCYNDPSTSELKLSALNEFLGLHGVEGIGVEGYWVDSYYGSCVASYCNTGDTYACTILLDHIQNKWRLISYGDFVESLDSGQNNS